MAALRPRVVAVFTGGTISMEVDPRAGGAVPRLDSAAILARAVGLEAIARVEAIDLGRIPASHFSFADLFRIAATVRRALADPGIAGAVVVQGTDTIEETAFAFDLLHADARPLVVTGAMRNASEPDADGPANLRDAVCAAAAPALREAGCVVVLAGTIEPADDVTKTHATALDTFRSCNAGRLGIVQGGHVLLERPRGPRRAVAAHRAIGQIALVTAATGVGGEPIDWAVEHGIRGIVVEATGAGNTDPAMLAAAERAMARGLPVVLTTRCPAGRAGAGYAFPGGGATWVRAGAMLAGSLGGPKARIALALGLGAGLDRSELAALLADPIGAGDPPGGAAAGR